MLVAFAATSAWKEDEKLKLRLVQSWARSLERSEEKKMMEADVQGDYQVMLVTANKRMFLAQQTENHQQEQTEVKG